jgi:hypothetical protein
MAELERDAEVLYRLQAREGLDPFTPEDKHETYKTLRIKVIAHPDGSVELTGRVFADVHSDNGGMIPNEEYHALAR